MNQTQDKIKGTEYQESDSSSGNSEDITIDEDNQKVNLLNNIDSNEIIPKSKTIVYPAGFFSSLTFNWLYKIIKNRTKDNPVKLSSLDEISPEVQSKSIFDEIKIKWYEKYNKKVKLKSTGYPLFMTLLSTNKKKIFISFILFFIRIVSELLNVLAFKEIITYFNIQEKRQKTLLSNLRLHQLIIIMLINKLIGLLSERQIVFYVDVLGEISTVQLNCLIYDKLLKIACYNKGSFNEGQIINLIHDDSEKFGIFISSSPEVIILPFKLAYSIYILFSFFHESFIIGFILLILIIYLFFIFGSKVKKYHQKMMKAADNRMNLTTQIFNIIKTIKLYVWENIFFQKIEEKRKFELDFMKNKFNMQVWSYLIYWISDVLLYSVSIIFYNLIHHQMDTVKIITGIYIVNDLIVPMFNLPNFIRFYFETIIGLMRIETFLSGKENEENQIKYLPKESEYAVIIENIDFGTETLLNFKELNKEKDIYDIKELNNNKTEKENASVNLTQSDDNIEPTQSKEINLKNIDISNINDECDKNIQEKKIIKLLKNINFKIKKGEHICIIGEVGSGKTCLLNAIINNLLVLNKPKEEGNIQLSGKVSFVSQNYWILNDTIKQNILFFKSMEKEKYYKILSICQLKQDLQIFYKGDQTEIGEKGFNLSGGQKARLAIARAVYTDADIYVFDDPLSSLDANVGRNLFNQVFNEYLKEKTLIISTHALQYVSSFDKVFYISHGEIKYIGKPDELEKQDFYQEFKIAKERKKNQDNSNNANNNKKNEEIINDINEKEIQIAQKEEIVITSEQNDGEKLSFKLFMRFIEYSGGIIYLIILGLCNIIWQANQIYREYYLVMWSSKKSITESENNQKMIYFVLMTIPGIIAEYFRQYFMVKGYMKYNIKMHDLLIKNLINAPINLFHDIVPRGNIINRLGKELNHSSILSLAVSITLRVIFQLGGAIIVCTILIYGLCP